MPTAIAPRAPGNSGQHNRSGRLKPARAKVDTRHVEWIVVGLIVVVLLGLALLWRQANEMERGAGSPALTRKRALGTWLLLVIGNAFRWFRPW
jgi:hypothetical protein